MKSWIRNRTTPFQTTFWKLPYDLSDVFFIATANSLSSIPAPLLDRTEIIQISGYTNPEKFYIARNHLIGKTLEEHGLDEKRLSFTRRGPAPYDREIHPRGGSAEPAEADRRGSPVMLRRKIVSGSVTLPYRNQTVGPDRGTGP